ncbi:MAG: MFS transporter [Gammaproteobacteria bacterium]|nr:MFS transporter [Gammaproteobacteria bacterium]
MTNNTQTKMTSTEWKAIGSISTIMALRMIGLFMMIPIFSLYATGLQNATPLLIGLALGIYGLFQALFQIPFGALSDRFGRKPIIFTGLLLFVLGSIIAGTSHSIFWMIVGRSLQGTGAVGATLLALMADLTREEHRTKAMAIAGISIGFSFSIALFIGPILNQWISVGGLFYLAAFLALMGMTMLYFLPTPPRISQIKPRGQFFSLITHAQLARLNIGIFILHTLFTATFVVLPIILRNTLGIAAEDQWLIYLPTLLFAFACCLIMVSIAERKQQHRFYFLMSISLLITAEVLLWRYSTQLPLIVFSLGCFFTGFSILEAFLPSLVSKIAPPGAKGSALGLYSFAQFSGIFVGGVMGGWLYGHINFQAVYLCCALLASLWLLIAFSMQTTRITTHMLKLHPTRLKGWESIAAQLQKLSAVHEVTFVAEEGIVYIKIEREVLQNPSFIALKEAAQSACP